MTHYEIINICLTIGTVIGQIFIIGTALLYVFKKEDLVIRYIGKHGLLFAFLTALVAMLGSLYYSEIVLFEPCKYCWLQRIFMYPQVILFGMALWRKTKDVIPYGMVLSGIGAIIAFRHYLLQMGQNETGVDNCALAGGVSCSEAYFLHLGYITIAMLSLTTFVMILLFLTLSKHYQQKNVSN